MKYFVVTVRDRASDVFGTPYCVPSVGIAERSFSDEINRQDANNNLYKHPDDFDLFLLGTYDDATASFECGLPKQLMLGRDAVKKS